MPTVTEAGGLPVRDVGAWTKDKLYYVERYARAFMVAMAPKRRQGKWTQLTYIDLLCGPGRCRIRDSGEEILSARALAVTFLDPEGFEVHFATLRALAARRVDILYLFPSGIGIKRNLRQFISSAGERMDRFWGGPEWRQLPMARIAAGKDPSPSDTVSIAGTWVGAFRQKVLHELHLRSDQTPPLITNDRNAPMYHLLFFSKDEAGLEIWRNISCIGPTGQRSFSFR